MILCLASMVNSAVSALVESNSSLPAITLVSPGIWRLCFGEPENFTPTHFQVVSPDKTGLQAMGSDQPIPLDVKKISFQTSGRGCSLIWPMKPGEETYGFGLHTELLEMSNRRVILIPTDKPENDLGESHAPVPFCVSSLGYGVFVDTARFASFYTGDVSPASDEVDGGNEEIETSAAALYRPRSRKLKTMLVDVPASKGVVIYLFAGPKMLNAVERYNLFSGGGAVPPLWGLGVHYRGYAKYGEFETLALARRIRAAHMPCDVWGVEPGWQSHAYPCSFEWATNRFPHPDAFLGKMKAMGFKMNLWEHAFTSQKSPIYPDLKPWSGNFLVWNGLVPDFASPQARKVFLQQNKKSLFDRGVESVKLDECDYQPDSPTPWSFPLCTEFPSGLDGELMHSLFGVLYQQTMWAPYQAEGLRTWGMARNSQALAAPLPYVIYSDSYDARCYVRALVNEGFSGLLWDPEVRAADSIEDLYRRLEVSIFSPDTVIDSWFIPNPPWDQVNRSKNEDNKLMPDRQAVADGVRQLLELRMRFIPYLYSAFNEYHHSGKPPIRALGLDWPDDPKARRVDDEFMFGDSVLVAPVFSGETNRSVYLPPGGWYDFWTHSRLTGGKSVEIKPGINQIPVFVKSSTMLPLAEPVEFVNSDTVFKINVQVFGKNPADFVLYEDDGITTSFASGLQNRIVLHASESAHSLKWTGNYLGPKRYKIQGWQDF